MTPLSEAGGRAGIPFPRAFQSRFNALNHLESTFQEWVFHPDMLFGATEKWWGDQGKRDRPHEGVDFCWYRANEEINYVNEKILVPAIFGGRVEKVEEDFLGESVFVSHDITGKDGSRLYTIYGHVKPAVAAGAELEDGALIGTVADARKRVIRVLSHLHITLAWIPEILDRRQLGWQFLNKSKISFVDPLPLLDCPYSVTAGR